MSLHPEVLKMIEGGWVRGTGDNYAAEREWARRCVQRAVELERGAMQAKIDRLMLEYCPEEMTPEQLAEWGKSQQAVVEDCPHAAPFRYCPECVDPCPLGLPQKRRGKP